MSENQTEESAILQELRQINNELGQLKTGVGQIKESQTALQTKVDNIETALYGTGNPHGGLFGKIEVLETKIDGMDKNFDRMFSFAKWTVGGLFVIFAVPIFFEIIWPIIKKGIGN